MVGSVYLSKKPALSFIDFSLVFSASISCISALKFVIPSMNFGSHLFFFFLVPWGVRLGVGRRFFLAPGGGSCCTNVPVRTARPHPRAAQARCPLCACPGGLRSLLGLGSGSGPWRLEQDAWCERTFVRCRLLSESAPSPSPGVPSGTGLWASAPPTLSSSAAEGDVLY